LSVSAPVSLLDKLQLLPEPDSEAARQLIPVHDHTLFLELVSEAARIAGDAAGDDLLIICDGHTSLHTPAVTLLARSAQQMVLLGESGEQTLDLPHISRQPLPHIPKEQDHLFVVLSKQVSIAVFGCARAWAGNEAPMFHGGWTVLRGDVTRIAREIVPEAAAVHGEASAQADPVVQQTLRTASALIRHQAQALVALQHDMAMDKNDLFAVLNILKAISSKRRAHDVLFVFVEQVARVVLAERCSIVRIWGSDKTGQVLASHEDSNVSHHEIELAKYPELRAALTTHQKIVVNDVQANPLTREIAPVLQEANIQALLVIPIVLFDDAIGSLFLRAARSEGTFALREISFFEVVAEAAANALERAHLFESIQIANERLERLAITDGLTGLYNHRYCRDRLEEEFLRASRYRLPLSCIIFDVDNFKKFNDTYGHLLGDSILREIAERTLSCIRKSDLVARYGGEEFVVIMPQTDLKGGTSEGERLRNAIASKPFQGVPEGVQVTVSVGVAALEHDTMSNYDDIIRTADTALYEAKRSGKNRVVAMSGVAAPGAQAE